MLPWTPSEVKYVVIDLNTREIIDFCDTDDQATRKAISESFGKNRNIEVFMSTGFNSWKSGLHQ